MRIAASRAPGSPRRRTCVWPFGRHRWPLECIGDVVDQDVLPGSDRIDCIGDTFRLGEGGCGISIERLAYREYVDLENRSTTQDRARGRGHVVKSRDDRFREHLGLDDHRVSDIDELLELLSFPAVEEGLRARYIGDATDPYAERLAHPRHPYLHGTTGTDRQSARRLRAEQAGARFVGPADDLDGWVLLEVSVVQAKDADPFGEPLGACRGRALVEIHERKRLCSRHAGDPADLSRQLVKAERFGGIGFDRDANLAAGEARPGTQRWHRLDG